ncbi:MAG: hypothetical protein F6K61_10275 [Sphaerospermopsis sp. SIO1G1]|nr:hypothetical protein [Sphaerospermopsis sp. SIO1G1]
MSSGKKLQPSKYAINRYNLTAPVDFDVALKYATVLMAVAGADGELAEAELQWYINEQELLLAEPEEYIEAVRKADWKNANLDELLSGISYDFSLNFRRTLLYQAIKMCRADGVYHDQEKAVVSKAAELLGIEKNVRISLESLAELEDSTERLRLSLFDTEI